MKLTNRRLTTVFRIFFFLSGFFGLQHMLSAQNLVPNPSMEEFTICPMGVGGGGPLPCEPWLSGPIGTSDYFNACDITNFTGVPVNFQGVQFAKEGVGYCGIYTKIQGSFWREYLVVQLTAPLEADSCYRVSMWINNADESCGTNQMGMYLSQEEVTGNPIGIAPQINYANQFFIDQVEWVNIFGYFTASGGEEWLTIGNFYSDMDTDLHPDCTFQFQYGYYYIDSVSVIKTQAIPFEFDLDGPVTACGEYTIDPGLPNVQFEWSTGYIGPTLTVTTSGTYSVTGYYGCNSHEAEIEVTIIPVFGVEIGEPFVTICEGEDYTISLDPFIGDYIWQDGSTATEYTITEAGLYSVTLDDGCQVTSDEVLVTVNLPPLPVDLGPDTYICPGDEIDFLFDPNLGDFTWQDGSTSNVYTIDDGGTYSLTISNQCGEEVDEIEIEEIQPPDVNLGADEFILCTGESIAYEFDPDMGTYVWQDGTISPNYEIIEPGNYSVTVTNVCGMDVEEVDVFGLTAPVVDLGPDIVSCEGANIVLNPTLQEGDYIWQDGSTGTQYDVEGTGVYSVTISNFCGQASDQINVDLESPVTPPDLGPDVTLCGNETYLLQVNSPGASFLWNNLSTADTLLVSEEGVYFVEVYNDCSSFSDTIVISQSNAAPDLMLPNDYALCDGLSTVIDPGIGGVTYLWSDGSSLPTLTVNAPGTYSLTITNTCGTDNDAITITSGGPAPTVSLGVDTSLCTGASITITPAFSQVTNWLWQDNSTNSTFTATTPGVIYVAASNACGTVHDTMNIAALPPAPVLDLGQDTSVCSFEDVVLTISIPGVDILWYDGSDQPGITVSDSGLVFAAISNSCGVSHDTISIQYLPDIPGLDLGPDQSICPGVMVSIQPNIPNVDYVWQDGSTNSSFQTNQPGTYHLTISNDCGVASDTIVITEDTQGPQLDLGPDLLACEGEIVTISSGVLGVDYLWQDGSIDPDYSTTVSGTFILEVSNLCGTDRDTVDVEISGVIPAPALGNDTLMCEGSTLLLTSNADAITTSAWQDGSSNATFLVTSSGTYWLDQSNRCGEATDTIHVEINGVAPEPDLGVDTTLCEGNTLLLTANVDAGSTWNWQDGTSGNTYLVSSEGFYWIEATNRCGDGKDTIEVKFATSPVDPDLGADTTLCEGTTLLLQPVPDPDADWTWQDGSQGATLMVSNPGIYYLVANNACGQQSDSIIIDYLAKPLTFNLGPDTILCPGESILLTAPVTANALEWQDGSSTPTLIADLPILYVLHISNSCGIVSDSLQLNFDSRIPLLDLPEEIEWCEGDEILLDATQPFDADYTWSTGETSSTILINLPGQYGVEVALPCADGAQQVIVIPGDDCATDAVFIPNVISPNFDQVNDVFTYTPSPGMSMLSNEVSIFDRWGNLVYFSKELPFRWDGTFEEKPLNPGVFVYIIKLEYEFNGNVRERMYYGDVTIIR